MQLTPLLILLLCIAFPASSIAKDKAVSVITAPVIQEHIVDNISVLGTSQANESIDITSKITDIISKIHFKEGQQVKKGQRLVQLDDAEQQALLQEAEVDLAEQQREYNRLAKLVKQKAISSSQLDTQLSRLKAAKARIKTAQVYIDERKIIAPFSGKLGLRHVSVGALLQSGDVITTLDDIQNIKLDFSIPEIYLASLHKGLKLTATTQAYPKRLFSGKITTINSRVDPVSRMLKLRAIIPNQDEALRAGMLLTVRLALNPRQALMISERALVPVGSQQFVYVMTENAIAERRIVEIGQRQVGKVEVTDGLALGEKVVVEGTLRLKPNTPIKEITAAQ
ncbi:efflux RND transporter periplasmic adaptor subunit [Candidatus Albibeggiatoa sp. nov. NOAA]|uniref:efflux RND transporter periplasmic adaptor subunit n=1 Tax=Candidatus Albibeggiatoa sp. nov. NOAA TaxID=3162724 RepID=UPI0032F535BF|nr:efflux RND transporter periplasmic adaptor subunit [Thiotrichaceae bacterium]